MIPALLHNDNQQTHQDNQQTVGNCQGLFAFVTKPIAEPGTGQKAGKENGDNHTDLQINITEENLKCKYYQDFASHYREPCGKKNKLFGTNAYQVDQTEYRQNCDETGW